MFINRRTVLTLAVCCLFSATTAFAGGGGTKRDSTIRFKNDTNAPIGVIVDKTQAQLQNANIQTPQQFINFGGKIVNPGATADFKVREGAHPIFAADDGFQPIDFQNVSVGRGATKLVTVTPNGFVL